MSNFKSKFIENIESSPYIEEGFWDKIKSFGKKPNATPVINSPITSSPYSPAAQWRASFATPVINSPITSSTSPQIEPKAKEFLNNIIHLTMKVVIDTVKKDTFRSHLYFKHDLPTQYDDPEWLKIKSSALGRPLNPVKIPNKDKDKGDEVLEPAENPLAQDNGMGFLYKYHANYRKNRQFTILVGKFNLTDDKNIKRNFEVLWSSHGHEADMSHAFLSTIKIKFNKDGKLLYIPIFRFYDHDVDSRSNQNFSVKDILKKNTLLSDSYVDDPSLSDQFHRALMATINRKNMEFKAVKSDKEFGGEKNNNVQDAIMALQKLGMKNVEPLIDNAIDNLGSNATADDITSYVLSRKPNPKEDAKAPKDIPPPTIKPPSQSADPNLNNKNSNDNTSSPNPYLDKLNKQLNLLGFPGKSFDSVNQAIKFNALRGHWNKKIINLQNSTGEDKSNLLIPNY